MMIEKIFNFSKDLEKGLENLLKLDNLAEDKKNQIEKNLNLVSSFNRMEFLSSQNKLNMNHAKIS